MNKYSQISSPLNYGGLELKNHIIFAPTTFGLKKDEYFKKIEEIAQGGCAMIIIGDVPVTKSVFNQSLFTKKGFKYYKELVKIAHDNDCKICAQLHQSDTKLSGLVKYIPQMISGKVSAMDLRELANKETGKYISNLSIEEVKKITDAFGLAALKAKEAGFDMVQVHGDRMCGSFSSVIFNTRNDIYGGSVVNRARFATEAVSSIRQALKDYPIDFKLAVRQENPHYGNAGVLFEEVKDFVPLLEKAGVTSFHVTLANHSRLEDPIPAFNHPEFSKEGCFLKFADEVKKYTKLPVCGVGGLNNPDFIEAQLDSGRIDAVAMSRQLIADSNWPNKVINGEINKIHKCVRCNKKCLGGMYEHKGVHCIFEGAK